MTKPAHSLAASRIDESSKIPLYRQVYDALRADIFNGVVGAGDRLAATREMADDLGVSRNTVLEAVEQLGAEGYLCSRVGAGTFVAETIPDDLLRPVVRTQPVEGFCNSELSSRGRMYARWSEGAQPGPRMPFQLGRPAVDAFPWREWNRIVARLGRELHFDWLDYSDSAGYRPLREILAKYLYTVRGIRCTADQVIVVRGSQQGLDLAARTLLDPGDRYWMEDPGYPAARFAFEAAGAIEVAVPVDTNGIDVSRGRQTGRDARLVYVTPSHQYPLGHTMSLDRRIELLQWAEESRAWIIEDDYDSEYRFAGRPLEALAGLSQGGNVVYLGTLSKVLFPALRLGYLVVPRPYVDAFVGARYAADRSTANLDQAVVAEFLSSGHFSRHLRKMRALYEHREAVLRKALIERLGAEVDVAPAEAGLHTIAWLRNETSEAEVVERAARNGVTVSALAGYCAQAQLRPALVLGFAGFPDEQLEQAVERLAVALERS